MSRTQNLLSGRYQFIQALSTDSTGQTFLAADTHYPGHPKCVVRQLRLPTRNPMTRKFILSLLKKKVEVLEGLGQHAQIPSTFAAFDQEQSFFIVQEYILGRSLQEELITGQPWSPLDVLRLFQDVLPVLAFAQEHGVVHGNLKPSKLIRSQKTQQLVVLDFGSIKAISQHVSNREPKLDTATESSSRSSRVYMAPEQLQRQSLFCSDHYALGIIAIQALTGFPAAELPSPKDATRHQHVSLIEDIPALDANLISVLARMVHPNPQQRYQKATEILADLKRLDTPNTTLPTQPAVSLAAEATPPAVSRRRSFPNLPYGLIGLVALGSLTLFTLVLGLKLPQRIMANQHLRAAATLAETDPKAAIARYDDAIAIAAQSADAYAQRGQLRFDLGQAYAALADLTQAIELDPSHPTYAYDRANIRFAVGDTQGAIGDYTTALRHDSTFVKAYVNRGSARADWGDDKGAIEDYTQALDLTTEPSTRAAAYLNRCLSHSNLDHQMQALADCTEAINLRPSHALAYQNRGLVRRRLRDFQGSLQDYNIAIQIAPDSPDPYYNRGLTRQAMGDYPGALDDFSQALAIAPDYVFALYDRGLLQADLGQTSAAIADLQATSQLCLELGRTGCHEDAQYYLSQLEVERATPATDAPAEPRSE